MQRVLVVSPDQTVEHLLRRELSTVEFDVVGSEPGPAAVDLARRLRPEIAVLALIGSQVAVDARMAAILRVVRPDARLILVSGAPSASDAEIVEAGVFYYMPTWLPARLPEIVRAAARSRRVVAERQTSSGEILP